MNSDKNDPAGGLKQQVADLTKQLSDLANIVKDQQTQIDQSKTRRMYQMDYTPGSVKNRAQGEANSYIYDGKTTDKPVTGASVNIGTNVYYDYQTKKLYIWNRTNKAWDAIQLS